MTTLGGYLDAYLAERVKLHRMSRQSAKDCRYTLVSFAESHGNRPLDQLTTQAVERWLETIHHLTPATRRNYLSRVRGFCQWLLRKKKIRRDPCEEIEPIRQPRQISRALPEDEVSQLLAVLPDLRAHVVAWLMVGCGLRCKEVARLGVTDYDRRLQQVTVEGKGGHERVVPVPSEVARVVDRYLTEERLVAGPLIRSRTHPSRGVAPKTLGTYMRQWMVEAGIKHRPWDGTSAHALRHTAATDVFDRCGNLRIVQEMLGHTLASTTSRYLGTADLSAVRDAMEGRRYETGTDPPEAIAA
jgi:site-specific recombinase XerD